MKSDEAIKELKEMIDYEWVTYQTKTAKKYCNALDTAIRSLEAWENMKNELEEFLENHKELHEWGRVLGAEQALDIVNKYLQEVEE